MTSRQKIFKVLKHIKNESEINPDGNRVSFVFNFNVIGQGILSADEEKRILMKLEKEGVIEIRLPNDEWKKDLSQFTPTESIVDNEDSILVEILPPLYQKYFWYNLISFADNKWNYINPFWILWQLLRGVVFLIEWLWDKNKVVTIILSTLGGLLIYDWSLAWKNFKIFLIHLGIL